MKIKFVGDISRADMRRLAIVGRNKDVLEFGTGGSTQVFAQVAKSISTVDTSVVWVKKTQQNLARIPGVISVDFCLYPEMKRLFSRTYDLIFDDGSDNKRREFAELTWPLLRVGGKMVFHDTRRDSDIAYVSDFIHGHIRCISDVEINKDDSHLTVVTKSCLKKYVNWRLLEKYPLWKYGEGEVPAEFWQNDDMSIEIDG